MKNASKKILRKKTSDNKLITFIICALLSASIAISVTGCSQKTLIPQSTMMDANVRQLVPKACKIINEAMDDNNPDIRTMAIEVVADTRQTRFMPKVQRLLKDEFVHVRFLAALAVGDMQYSLAESDTALLLKDKDENVRIAAAYAMLKLGYAENMDNLYKAIASDNQTVRANAALLLGKTGDKGNLKFLYWALQHKDSEDKVRLQAVEAIAKLGDERIYPKLWAMLRNIYADDRVTGIRGMGELATENAKNVLITMLDDSVPEVRLAAAEQLGKLGDNSGEPEVLDILRKNSVSGLAKEDNERIKARAALAIGHIGTTSLTKYLPDLLENQSKPVRIAAAKAVFQSLMKK